MKYLQLFSFIILFGFVGLSSTFAQGTKLTPEEYLSLPTDKVFPILHGMDKESAKELITQIRQTARKDYAPIDNFYFLISHLESIRAIEEEQARLRSLNWVYALGLILFVGFLGWVYYSQARIIQEIKRLQK